MIPHGTNLIPEGLETGEFKIGGTAEIDDLEPAYIVAFSGDTLKDNQGGTIDTVNQNGYSYNGIYSSITFAVCNDYGFNVLMAFLNNQDNSNFVVAVFTVPKLAVKSLLPNDSGGTHTYYYEFIPNY